MAKKYNSETTGNDEYFDNVCSPCSKGGKRKEALKFCEECGTYLCIQCINDHCRSSSLQLHRISDIGELSSLEGKKLVDLAELCDIHHGRIVDKYCKDHDEVCCRACVTGKHRSCVNLVEIDEVATSIDSTEQKEANERMDTVIANIKSEQKERALRLSAITREESLILKDIDKYEESIIKRVKKLAEASRTEVVSKHAKVVKDIKAGNKELESVLSVSEEVVKKLNKSDLSAAQAFVNIKKSNTMAKSVTETLQELLDFTIMHLITASTMNKSKCFLIKIHWVI